MFNYTIAVVFKDEPYLLEWIEYHRLIGFEHFIMFDNSTFMLKENQRLLEPYIKAGIITYEVFQTVNTKIQGTAIRSIIRKYKHLSYWCAFIDLDEFIFIPSYKQIGDILADYDKPEIGGLAIFWVFFGSSGYKETPEGLNIEKFIYRSKFNFNRNFIYKTISKLEYVKPLKHNHFHVYSDNKYAVNENFQPTPNYKFFDKNNNKWWKLNIKPSHNLIRLNHYAVRSHEQFNSKMKRGYSAKGINYTLRYFQEFDRNEKLDISMSYYWEELNERITQASQGLV